MEKKKKFRNYPDPMGHMFLWSFGIGGIAAIAMTLWLFSNAPYVYFGFPMDLIVSLSLYYIVAGLSGIMIGLLSGWVLSQVLKEAIVPFTWEEAQTYRTKAYTFVALTSAVGAIVSILLLTFIVGFVPESLLILLVAVPMTVLATYHYFSRLRRWSIAISQKEKNLYFEHLEDELELEEEDINGDEEKRIQRIS